MNLTTIKYIVAALIALGATAAGYRHGVTTTTDHFNQVIARANELNAQALTKATDAARKDEHDKAAAASAIDKQTIQDKDHEIASRDSTIAAYGNGTLRLRDKFTCGASTATPVREAAAGAGQRDAATTSGLQPEDVRFLVSEASRANQYAKQLMSCQALVNADRGVK